MSIEKDLHKRSGSKCELCGNPNNLNVYEIPPTRNGGLDGSIHICETCNNQIENPEKTNPNHWRCLNDSMWSQESAVQVIAWRILNRLGSEDWAQSLLEMLYLDDESLKWAQATGEGQDDDTPKHKDSNGNLLQAGDSVVLIKSLAVKGSSLTAKRGTVVRKISLAEGNHEHIEGRVEGQQIVILTKFVKKTN